MLSRHSKRNPGRAPASTGHAPRPERRPAGCLPAGLLHVEQASVTAASTVRVIWHHVGHDDGVGLRLVQLTLAEGEVGRHLLLPTPGGVVDHHRHGGFPGHLIVGRRAAQAQGYALQVTVDGHASGLSLQAVAAVALEEHIDAQGSGSFPSPPAAADHLLDQTGQGLARLTDDDESEQVKLVVSDRAQAVRCGTSQELRPEPTAIVLCPDRGTGSQRGLGGTPPPRKTAEQYVV